jgi:hypothetical protein
MVSSFKDKRTPITTPSYQLPSVDVTPDPPIFSLVTTFKGNIFNYRFLLNCLVRYLYHFLIFIASDQYRIRLLIDLFKDTVGIQKYFLVDGYREYLCVCRRRVERRLRRQLPLTGLKTGPPMGTSGIRHLAKVPHAIGRFKFR